MQVSTAGGSDPQWRRDGKEMFYLATDGQLMAVPVDGAYTTFRASNPAPLFQTRLDVIKSSYPSQYSVSANGQRFLLKIPVEESTAPPIVVILNWMAGLAK